MRGRFAPTPSGRMHLGNAFAALVAWLSARSAGGEMVLRVEDLDPRANSRERAELLADDLRWLGLDWDEGPLYQSERGELYDEALWRLAAAGLTYPCFCSRAELHAASAPHASDGTPVYAGTCRGLSADEVARRSATRPPATRLRVPDEDDPAGKVEFCDLAYGARREVLARDCGDFLVRRSDRVVAYQLAVVVDDALMGVTQVVRGRDLLGSCARQIYLHRVLGWEPPRVRARAAPGGPRRPSPLKAREGPRPGRPARGGRRAGAGGGGAGSRLRPCPPRLGGPPGGAGRRLLLGPAATRGHRLRRGFSRQARRKDVVSCGALGYDALAPATES